jgi:mannose-6-phosphate isomerase-like protein (cupin superfamily)
VTVKRPWGEFQSWGGGDTWNLKTIRIAPGGVLSLQSHQKRDEMWIVVEGEVQTTLGDISNVRVRYPGDFVFCPRRCVHRIASTAGAVLVEVSLGVHDELDIERYEDVYGRAESEAN